jgi:type II secretion system protein I
MRRGGFTLLEMLVATLIMGIAVVGLLSNISTSLQHASRLADYDRAALLARRKMNELLLDTRLPKDIFIDGRFDPATTGVAGGWRARVTSFEEPPDPAPGTPILERIELEIWWGREARLRRFSLEAFRRAVIQPATAAAGSAQP